MAPKIDTQEMCPTCKDATVNESTKSPGSRNEFARKSKKMKIPMQMDNKDYGKKTKAVARTVDLLNSKTGAYYGSKTIMTKETKTFTEFLITENSSDEITTLPDKVLRELKSLIRKGAADLQQNWKDALELTNKAYHIGNVRKPTPDQKGAWKQYTDLLTFGVQQLSATRGRDGKWRKTEPVAFTEGMQQRPDSGAPVGSHRYFVTIPGQAAVEADAKNMDEIIEKMSNKCRRGGAKVRVEERSKLGAKLSVWVDDIKRDTITIQDIS
jgi:hypothetical protein